MEANHSDPTNADHQKDLPIILKGFCLLLPPVGIIMYFVHKYQGETLQAKSAILYAMIGVVVNIVSVLFSS